MARIGKFGRSTSGQQNLSSFIRGLVAQNIKLEQKALFDSFYDGSLYGGKNTTFSDLQDFVDGRLSEGDLSEAEIAYYNNLLKNAQNFQIDKTNKSLSESFTANTGANFEEYVKFLKGEGFDKYGTDLGQVVKNYVTYAYNDLVKSNITEEEYNSLSQKALSAVVDDANTYNDVKFDVNSNLYKYQLVLVQDMVDKADGKKASKVIAANKELLSWYEGWKTKLQTEGIGGTFYSNVTTEIQNTKDLIKKQEVDASNAAAAAFLAQRKGAYDSAMGTLNAFAKAIGSTLGVDTSSATFGFADLQKASPAGLTAWLESQPESTRIQVQVALDEAARASKGYVNVLNSQGKGNSEEALTASATVTATKKVSGENTSYDEYITGVQKKAIFMTAAGNIPGNEKIVMTQWAMFLRGKTTTMFGDGLETITNPALDEIQVKIDNEAGLYEAALRGEKITQIPSTLMDEVIPSLVSSGFLPKLPDTTTTGDNRYSIAEFSNVIDTVEYDAGFLNGTKQISYPSDPSLPPLITDIKSPAPGAGYITRLEQDAAGNNYAAQYQGVPIYGSYAGQPDTSDMGLWGYKIETSVGPMYASKDGIIYKTPPLDIGKLMLAADGKSIISRESKKTVLPNGQEVYQIKSTISGTEAVLSDLVNPNASTKAQSLMVNPYARVNSDNPALVGIQGTNIILQSILDTVPANSALAVEALALIEKTTQTQTELSNMASVSQDPGVRIAMMNAELAAAKVQRKKEEFVQLATIRPIDTRGSFGTNYQTGGAVQPQQAISYNGINQATPTGAGNKTEFDLGFVFRGLATLANPIGVAGAIGNVIGQGAAGMFNKITAPGPSSVTISPGLRPASTITPRMSSGGVSPAVNIVGVEGYGPVMTSVKAASVTPAAQAAFNAFRAGEIAPLNGSVTPINSSVPTIVAGRGGGGR